MRQEEGDNVKVTKSHVWKILTKMFTALKDNVFTIKIQIKIVEEKTLDQINKDIPSF